jgi:hypothetical protein
LVGAPYITPTVLPDGNILYVGEVDDGATIERWWTPPAGFFLAGRDFAGTGVIVGPPDDDGHDTDATCSAIDTLNDIQWSPMLLTG